MKKSHLSLSAAFLAAFALLSLGVGLYPGLESLDEVIYGRAGILTHPAWLAVNRVVTFFGDSYFIIPASALIAACFALRRRFREALWYLVAVVMGLQVNYGFKLLFARQRPVFFDETIQLTTFSYPSGHAFGSVAFYGLAYWTAIQTGLVRRNRQTDIAVALLIAAIAASRVFLGVHWGMDILGGALLGTSWLFLCLAAAVALGLFRKGPR